MTGLALNETSFKLDTGILLEIKSIAWCF